MRLSVASLLLAAVGAASAASSWTFSDGSVTVSSKTSGDTTENFTDKQRVTKSITLGHADTIKVSLTAKEGSKAKRPHQAFLVIKEASGLEAPFPLTVKDSGKGTVEISQRELPIQLRLAQEPLEASLILGSFGSAAGSVISLFDINVQLDPNSAAPAYEAPLRYAKGAEIKHTFRADPKSPPELVSIAFALAVAGSVPPFIAAWGLLEANLNHLPKALSSAPVAHITFIGSIVAMEFVFFLYFVSWNLFQVLPLIGAVGTVAFLSGTRALSEVQSRRLAGER